MKVDINKLIEELAKQLGVAAEKVYPMLYKQVIVDGIWNLIWVFMSFGFLLGALKLTKILKHKLEEDYEDWVDYPHIIVPMAILYIAFPIIFFTCAKTSLDCLVNTDWQVIQYVLEQIK